MARGTGTATCTPARARGAATAEIEREELPYGVLSRKALGLADPIAPLYALPSDAPSPEVPFGPDEVAALDPLNKVRVAYGFQPLTHLRGGKRSGWTRRNAVSWALETAIPRGARIRAERVFNEEFLTLRVPTRLDYRGYDEAVAIVEQIAASFDVELQRGPYGAPNASYGMGFVEFIVPLPEALSSYFAHERVPGWEQPLLRPALSSRLRRNGHMGGKIAKKSQMYKLYEEGAFGNKLRTWDSLEAFTESGYGGTVTLRYKGKAGGGWCAYDVPPDQVETVAAQWITEGAERKLIVVNESAPDERLTVQGDVTGHPMGGGLVFRYSTQKAKMRDAMKSSKHAYGAEAVELLERHLSPGSLEDVRELLALYPDAVVEFSAYEHMLGQAPGRNAVIWEVRNY